MRVKCFTLIEMLLVVAIIAILASLLLSALGNARNLARTLQCVNNQKQIALSMIQYAGDYNGSLAIGSVVGFEGMPVSWDRAIAHLLGTNLNEEETHTWTYTVSQNIPAMACPADNGKREPGHFTRSYALNAMLNAGETEKAAAAGCPNFNGNINDYITGIATYCATSDWGNKQLWSARLDRVAGNTIMATDFHNPANWIGGTGGTGLFGMYEFNTTNWNPFPHAGKLSFSYCDGHAEYKKMDQTFGAGGNWVQPRGEWTSFRND